MHPAPSVILFTVLSGLGFGFLACLGVGLVPVSGHQAFFAWGLGYCLALIGLLASSFHLGRPSNAIYAFSQWRSSWLSREGIGAVVTLLVFAPQALIDWLGDASQPRLFGTAGAALALVTIYFTAMIYAQLKTVPRWNHWLTPVMFFAACLTGGLLLSGQRLPAALASALLACILLLQFKIGDGLFRRRALSTARAIGLDHLGQAEVFEQPHTGQNYLMREMIFSIGRKRSANLRRVAVVGVGVIPVLALLILPFWAGLTLAVLSHLIGLLAARWLFFAEAEHVVGLYYGMR